MIAIGYRAPQDVSGVANSAAFTTQQIDNKNNLTEVNDVVASTIAASVATATNLSVAPSVTSLAISTQIESELPTSDDASISKPQILQLSSSSREITKYTVQPGDTVATLASKFNISKDTIMWANDLTSENLQVGKVLDILPRDGIVYTVKSGDTIEGIADKYKSDASVIRTYNDLEISGINDGLKIIVPSAVLPEDERPGYVPPFVPPVVSRGTSSGGAYANYSAGSGSNRYAPGNCTWWVYERRAAMGHPIGNFWGNGGSWAYSGAAAGYRVDNSPEAGAILVELGSPGHVAFVERVTDNGEVILSEMNNAAYGGFNIVNSRTLSAGQAALYRYVH